MMSLVVSVLSCVSSGGDLLASPACDAARGPSPRPYVRLDSNPNLNTEYVMIRRMLVPCWHVAVNSCTSLRISLSGGAGYEWVTGNSLWHTPIHRMKVSEPPHHHTPIPFDAIRTVSERFVTAVSSRHPCPTSMCSPRVRNHISPNAACSSAECAATPQSRQPSGKAVNRYAGHAHTLRWRTIIRLYRLWYRWMVHPARAQRQDTPLPPTTPEPEHPRHTPYQNIGYPFIPCPPAE